jgi:hypothetical protein
MTPQKTNPLPEFNQLDGGLGAIPIGRAHALPLETVSFRLGSSRMTSRRVLLLGEPRPLARADPSSPTAQKLHGGVRSDGWAVRAHPTASRGGGCSNQSCMWQGQAQDVPCFVLGSPVRNMCWRWLLHHPWCWANHCGKSLLPSIDLSKGWTHVW